MQTGATLLTARQRKHLRGLAHALSPVCSVGTAGVSEAFLAELEAALAHHELIKVKVGASSRAERDAAITSILARTGAGLVTRIGNVAVLYRRSPDKPRVELPAA